MRDNTETKIIYKGQLLNDADELRETAKSDMCDNYCKYGTKVDDISDDEYKQMTETVCAGCPLIYL